MIYQQQKKSINKGILKILSLKNKVKIEDKVIISDSLWFYNDLFYDPCTYQICVFITTTKTLSVFEHCERLLFRSPFFEVQMQ